MLGKLLASLLSVLVMLAAALPLFMLTALLGGVSYGQIARAMAVTLATVLVCGSLGSLLALWREKTFQALAMTVLVLVLWLAVGEIVAAGVLGEAIGRPALPRPGGRLQPLAGHPGGHPPLAAAQPALGPLGTPVNLFLLAGRRAAALLLNGRGHRHGARVESIAAKQRQAASEYESTELRAHERGTSRQSAGLRYSVRHTPRWPRAASGTTRSSGGKSAPGPTGGRSS